MLESLFSPAPAPGMVFRALAAVLFTGIAAYYDVSNRKWVPDWIAYLAVALALAVNIIFFNATVFMQALVYGAFVFAATYALYRIGQLGGADVYIMASIAAAIPHFQQPFLAAAQEVPYPFIFSVLIPTGIAFVLHMLLRFIPYISRQLTRGKVRFGAQKIAEGIIIIAAAALFIFTLTSLPLSFPPAYIALLSFLSIALLFFSLFKQEIKDSMVEMVPSSRLCEEDVLAIEKMDQDFVRKHSISPLLNKRAIDAIRRAKLKSAPVYTGMPFFLPYLFIGLLFTLLFGDLFFHLL